MRYFRTAAVSLALAACSAGDNDAAPAPTRAALPANVSGVFVLGDSLSDVGNAAGMADFVLDGEIYPPTVGLCNPADVFIVPRPCEALFYGKSRVSDGPVAVEHLAAALGLGELVPSLHLVPDRPVSGTNYAIAGAKARGRGESSLTRQIDALLLEHGGLAEDAVYVVMIGGNDAIDALQAAVDGAADPPAETSAEIVAAAVDAVGDEVERLLDFGARRLVVANVPDLAALPAVLDESATGPDEAAVLAEAARISRAFNSALSARLDEIEARGGRPAPEPVLARFDLLGALEAHGAAAAAAGRNVTAACFDSEAYRQSSAERRYHPDCAPLEDGAAPRFERFVFWDGIHPTGETHAAIGAALADLFEVQ